MHVNKVLLSVCLCVRVRVFCRAFWLKSMSVRQLRQPKDFHALRRHSYEQNGNNGMKSGAHTRQLSASHEQHCNSHMCKDTCIIIIIIAFHIAFAFLCVVPWKWDNVSVKAFTCSNAIVCDSMPYVFACGLHPPTAAFSLNWIYPPVLANRTKFRWQSTRLWVRQCFSNECV